MAQTEFDSQIGKELFDKRKFAEAARVFEQSIARGESENWLYNLLGHSYLYLQRYDEALKVFWQMRSIFPESPRFYAGLGKVYDAQRKFKESRNILKEGLTHFPDSVDIWRGLLLILYRLEDYDGALATMDQISEKFGEKKINRDLGLLHVFGLVYEKVHEINKSEHCFREMTQSFPNHPLGRMALAHLYTRAGSIIEALDLWEKIYHDFPDRWDIFRSYCSLLTTLGKYEEAITLLLKSDFLESNPVLWTDILRNLQLQLNFSEQGSYLREILYNPPKFEINHLIKSVRSTHDEISWVSEECQGNDFSDVPVRVLLLAAVLSHNQKKWDECLSYLNRFVSHQDFVPEWQIDILSIRFQCLLFLGRFEEMDLLLQSIPEDAIPVPILTQWAINLGHRYLKNQSLEKIGLLEKRVSNGVHFTGGFIHQIEKFKGIDAAKAFSKKYLKSATHLRSYYLHHCLLSGSQSLQVALNEKDVVYDWDLLLDMLAKAKYMGAWDSVILLLQYVQKLEVSSESAFINRFNIIIEAKAIENLLLTKIKRGANSYVLKDYLTDIRSLMHVEFRILDRQPFSFSEFLTLGHNKRMIKDFATIDFSDLYFIQEKFSQVYLNTYMQFADALEVASEIRKRILSGTPTSMIRLGDGEGMLLGAVMSRNKVDARKIQRLWWGNEILSDNDIEIFVSSLEDAMASADILGIPGWNRVIRDLNGFRGVLRNESARGIIHVHEAVRKVAQSNMDTLSRQIITSAHLPMDLNYWNLFDFIFSDVTSCTIITSHSGMPAILSERYGFREVKVIRLSGEYAYLNESEKSNYRPPFPERHNEVMQALDQDVEGLYLVAAGVLGKTYCHTIKERGGIALDIGALVDYWLGFRTRSRKLHSSSVLDTYRTTRPVVKKLPLWTTISHTFRQLFTPKSDVLVLSVFRSDSGYLRYTLSENVLSSGDDQNNEYLTMYYVSRTRHQGMQRYYVVKDDQSEAQHFSSDADLDAQSRILYQFFAYPSRHGDAHIQRIGVNKIDGDYESKKGFFPLKDVHYHDDITIEENTAFKNRISTPKVSIVMTYYQRKEQLEYTMKTIYWSGFDLNLVELIIVDDGSSPAHSLTEWIEKQSLGIKLIVLGPKYKRDKNYCNPSIPYNIGFGEVRGQAAIIQNPEVCHIGDVLQYTTDHVNELNYLVFTCAGMPNDDLNSEVRSIYNGEELDKAMGSIRSLLEILSVDALNNPYFWYSHGTYQASAFHFLTAIASKHLFALGGFLEEFAFGFCADDNEFVFRIRHQLKLEIEFVDHNCSPFGIHQWHPKFLYFQNNLDYLHFKNRQLLSRLVATEDTLNAS